MFVVLPYGVSFPSVLGGYSAVAQGGRYFDGGITIISVQIRSSTHATRAIFVDTLWYLVSYACRIFSPHDYAANLVLVMVCAEPTDYIHTVVIPALDCPSYICAPMYFFQDLFRYVS